MSLSKKMRFGVPSAAIEQAGEILASGDKEKIIHEIPIRMIELDPDNRPMTKLRLDNPAAIDKNDPYFDVKTTFLDELRGLAQSIESDGGVQQPIQVYKRGANYRVVFGERRVLASVLAKRSTVPAVILPGTPTGLVKRQIFENLQRKKILPWEAVLIIRRLVEDERREGREIVEPGDLARIVCCTERHARTLLAILDVPKDVEISMEQGRLRNLKSVVALRAIDDPAKRAEALKLAEEGEPLKVVHSVVRRPAPQKKTRSGRKRKAINLGKTTNGALIKRILEALGKGAAHRGVNWKDLEQVQQVWTQFLKSQ